MNSKRRRTDGEENGTPSGSHPNGCIPYEDIMALLQCPVCLSYVSTPILQCSNGHIICNHCLLRVAVCPLCRAPKATAHNLVMEKIAQNINLPCRFSYFGCKTVTRFSEKHFHEYDCESQPFNCPLPDINCAWQGPLSQIMNHINVDHGFLSMLESDQPQNMTIENRNPWILPFERQNEQFVLMGSTDIRDSGQTISTGVWIIGNRSKAQQFKCRLEIRDRDASLQTQYCNVMSIADKTTLSAVNPNVLQFNNGISPEAPTTEILQILVEIIKINPTSAT